ncbi:MAG: D-aminoacyl-tRNA deacylase [Candidatus Omnitrophica bacterium]|nr:D-aminoacyl-tRNA deacylase [Candidatus Omnitrophota bacterium]HOX55022.1 D-aminoacyl-tRNA deacylase [Candidatus Omnitrophota bacterium]
MKAVIQRVKEATVKIETKDIGKIKKGILILLCVEEGDTQKDADFLSDKIINLRMFEDANHKMNLSCLDIKGEFLVISQFTLSCDCSKGRRPSFDGSAKPDLAEKLYLYFIDKLKQSSLNVEAGVFGAMMDIHLVNYGPVTFILNSRQ